MIRTTRAAVIWSVLLALTAAAAGHETDQFTLPPDREFADQGEFLNRWTYRIIERAVEKRNAQIRAAIEQRRGEAAIGELQSPHEIVNAVNGQMPWAMDVIEGLEKASRSDRTRLRYPGRVTAYKQELGNIYQHVHFPLDPRQIVRLFLGSTLEVYGTHLGTDKVGHFTDMGMNYYREYRRSLGQGEEQAMQRAIGMGTSGLIFSEKGFLGYLTAGGYSNGDLVANYVGLLFYRNLTDPMMIKGQVRPPMLVLDGPYWKIADHVRPDSDFFALFVSDHYNEVLNPSHFEAGFRSPIRKAIRDRAGVFLNYYLDANGNRRSPQWFDQRLEELKTYWGVDYGHKGKREELITVSDTCYAPLPEDAAVTARDLTGHMPLHQAVWRGDLEAVRKLLERGADPNGPVRSDEPYSPEWGNTPLHVAARDGRLDIAEVLIAAGARVDAANDRGATPLHRAIAHPAIAELLLAKGSSVDAPDRLGRTALSWAAGDPESKCTPLLLARGADANRRDRDARTPLHRAAEAGHAAAAEELIWRGADRNAADRHGTTSLHLAAARRDTAVLTVLLRSGASLKAKDLFGWTPLHDAARRGSQQGVSMLLEAGADPRAVDAYGNTPLHLAARYGRLGVASLLLGRGADPSAQNRIGMTPLHGAAFSGDLAVATLLRDRGAQKNVRNHRGLTPAALASERGEAELAQLLKP